MKRLLLVIKLIAWGIYQDRLSSAKVKLDKAKSEVTKFQEECDNIQSKIDFITTLRDKVKALFSGANFTISSMRINDIGNIIYLDIDDISVLDSLVKLSKATEVKVKGKEFKEFEGTIKGVKIKIKMFEADGYLVIKIENYKKSLSLK